jgi:hypothetical protein
VTELDVRDVQAPDGWSAAAVRWPVADAGEPTWIYLVTPDEFEGELWLCTGGTWTDEPLDKIGFPPRDGVVDDYLKHTALLGMPWEELEEELVRTTQWQQECMRRMPAQVWARFDNSTLDEIVEWRRDLQTMTAGELFQAQLIGDEPGALRN